MTNFLAGDLLGIIIFVIFLALSILCAILLVKTLRSSHESDLTSQAKLNDHFKEIFQQKLTDIFGSIEGMLKLKTEESIEEFSKKLEKIMETAAEESANQQKAIANEAQYLVANKFAKIQKELEEYRDGQLAKIDEQIYAIVFEAAREVLGRSISRGEHEDLVRKALERAKKDHFFV